MKRSDAISKILDFYPEAFVILSNGLTSREAAFVRPENRCFYMLHAMGEALSVGISFAQERPDLEVVVIDGDANALMGLSAWSLMPIFNLKYYILVNGMCETTGGQPIQKLPIVPSWCNIIQIDPGKLDSPNPPSPSSIWDRSQGWLKTVNKTCPVKE